eukprot:UN00497
MPDQLDVNPRAKKRALDQTAYNQHGTPLDKGNQRLQLQFQNSAEPSTTLVNDSNTQNDDTLNKNNIKKVKLDELQLNTTTQHGLDYDNIIQSSNNSDDNNNNNTVGTIVDPNALVSLSNPNMHLTIQQPGNNQQANNNNNTAAQGDQPQKTNNNEPSTQKTTAPPTAAKKRKFVADDGDTTR